jgi:hypothetical protein
MFLELDIFLLANPNLPVSLFYKDEQFGLITILPNRNIPDVQHLHRRQPNLI